MGAKLEVSKAKAAKKQVKVFKTQLVMRRSDPNRLDLRYKRNKVWLEQVRKENQLTLPF